MVAAKQAADRARVQAKAHRLQQAESAIAEAMAGDDPSSLEGLLRDGLAAGCTDELLECGLVRVAELEEARLARAAELEELRRRECEVLQTLIDDNPEATLRTGSLVQLRGLTRGSGPFGLGEQQLDKFNGRLGRTVERAPPHLAITAPPGASLADARVSIHLGCRPTDADQRHGVWLQVSPAYVMMAQEG